MWMVSLPPPFVREASSHSAATTIFYSLLPHLLVFWTCWKCITSLWPVMSVCWLVGRSVGRSVGWLVGRPRRSVSQKKGWKLHFNASIGSLVIYCVAVLSEWATWCSTRHFIAFSIFHPMQRQGGDKWSILNVGGYSIEYLWRGFIRFTLF